MKKKSKTASIIIRIQAFFLLLVFTVSLLGASPVGANSEDVVVNDTFQGAVQVEVVRNLESDVENAATSALPADTQSQSPATAGTNYNVYYGSLHAHTTYSSDGSGGPPAAAYAYARDVAQLDFFGISDHDEDITPAEWADTLAQADAFNQDGVFVTFRGFEWSPWLNGGEYYGHITIVNTANYIKWNEPSWKYDSYDEIMAWLDNQPDGIAIFNHPGRNHVVNGRQFELFTHGASSKVIGIELWNGGTGGSFPTYYYTDGYHTGDGGLGFYDEALIRGIKIGAAGGCDTHDQYWCNHGSTDSKWRMAVLATEKTRAAIYSAMQARRIFSTLDKNLTMSFQMDGQEMGSTIAPGTYNMTIKAGDANNETFSTIKLIRNGTVINTWNPNSSAPVISQNVSTTGGEYYYILVTQQDGDEAISSPIWIDAGANPYTLTVTSAHGTVTKNPDRTTYAAGEVVQVTVTPDLGWSFSNWSGDASGASNPVSVTMNANKSITANYTQNQYTLTVSSAHGAVTKTPNKATYTYGEVVQVSISPEPGWSFANWSGDASGASNPVSVTMNANKSITANYTQNQYTLTVSSAHGAVTKTPNKATYAYGEVVQVSVSPEPGWSFSNWSGDASGASNPLSVTMNANKSITANYTQNQYTLTVSSAHGAVTKTPNKATYTYGEVVQVSISPEPGWSFSNWSEDASGASNPLSVTMDGHKAITANYTQNQYTLTIISELGTVIRDPDKSTYTYGEVVELTAVPEAGWGLAHWSGDISGDTNTVSVTIDGDKFITANYFLITYIISGNAGVSGAMISYVDGGSKTATTDENGNYSITFFPGWSGSLTPSKSGYVFSPASLSFNDVQDNFANQNFSVVAWPDWSGGAVVTSDRPVVSVGRPHVGTEVMTYNGFGSGSQTMYVPMLFKNAFGGSYNAALYVQNTDVLGSATVSVKYYDAGGSLTCAVNNVSIAPLAIQSYWLPSVGCLPVGWVGGAVITADKEIVAVGRPHIGSQVTSYGGFGAGNARMYVPMLFKGAFGGTYNAALYVQNTDSLDSATFSIDYYDSTGQLTCSVSGETLAPLASKGYWLPSVGCLPAGWVGGAMITADKDVVAIGRPHIGAQVTTYNGFSGGAASLRVPMLFKGAFGGSYNAALYVQNTDVSQDANIRINFYDTSGNLTCYVEDSLAAQASKGYWLPSVGCLPAGWVGGAVVTSDREIVSVGRPHVGAEVATYGGFTSGSTSLYLPMLFRNAFGGGYNAAFYVQNTDEVDAANVTFKLYDTAGNLSCLTSTSIPAGATVGYWLPNLTCTP
jgi:hypothetical protein